MEILCQKNQLEKIERHLNKEYNNERIVENVYFNERLVDYYKFQDNYRQAQNVSNKIIELLDEYKCKLFSY